jgi:hypothetical protein
MSQLVFPSFSSLHGDGDILGCASEGVVDVLTIGRQIGY